jgi:23S rRNA (adenine2503-C2)-methyltransferase
MPSDEQKRNSLLGLTLQELTGLIEEMGEPAYRGKQLFHALYFERIPVLEQISVLSKVLRNSLNQKGFEILTPAIEKKFISTDGTVRYLLSFLDGQSVEAVWMPEGDGGEIGDGSEADDQLGTSQASNRATICLSSQVGCAVDCQFCLTAKLGLKRNLSAGEIVGQVCAVLKDQKVLYRQERVNLVFMGMGEPFLNYDNFMSAVRLLVREVGLSPQRMTVSTSGIVPGIERFAQEPLDVRPKLAISLNAPNDEIRAEVMPINRKWPIAAVVDAVRPIQLRPHERITFEYVLLGGVTDLPEHARELARLVRRTGLPAKVNLIAWNPGPEFHYSTPKPETAEQFKRILIGAGVSAYIRQPRGRDIFAACGQLKRTVES